MYLISYTGTVKHLRFLLGESEEGCPGCGGDGNKDPEELCTECQVAALNV